MMWGDQVPEEEAILQMHLALEHGINLWDTAEMYTIPAKKETQGNTERIIGNFFEKNPTARKNVFLATKVCGRGARSIPWIRDGQHFLDEKNIRSAVEGSLKRLKTDAIDLYQIHWPDRGVPIFGKRVGDYHFEEQGIPIEETLSILTSLVREGKIRYIGVSNETPWGMMEWIMLSKQKGYEQIVSIQNAYNLLTRQFEGGLSEIALREKCGLMAYSPLAMGVLSGKYLGQKAPKNSRMILFPEYGSRYRTYGAEQAIQEYVKIAHYYGLDPVQMALAFLSTKPFMTSILVGATSQEQLLKNIKSLDVRLSPEVISAIEETYMRFPDPCA